MRSASYVWYICFGLNLAIIFSNACTVHGWAECEQGGPSSLRVHCVSSRACCW